MQVPGEPGLLRVTVYLETDMGIDIVREVEVAVDDAPDLWVEADQWTQETIIMLLQPRGWELIAAADPPTRDPDEIPRSPRYVVRSHFWVPPPGWADHDPEG